jgi:hypothetical protein
MDGDGGRGFTIAVAPPTTTVPATVRNGKRRNKYIEIAAMNSGIIYEVPEGIIARKRHDAMNALIRNPVIFCIWALDNLVKH